MRTELSSITSYGGAQGSRTGTGMCQGSSTGFCTVTSFNVKSIQNFYVVYSLLQEKNQKTCLTMLWSTDLLVCNMNNLERKWEVILQIFEARSWSCITEKFCLCWEWGMEPKELLSISQGCGITSNNMKTGFRGICSTKAQVNSLYINLYIFFQTLHLGKSTFYFPNQWNMSWIN